MSYESILPAISEDKLGAGAVGISYLLAGVGSAKRLDPEQCRATEAMQEHHGAFVTLHLGEQLRGCIGHIHHTMPLVEVVIESAINASTKDPRFDAVLVEGLDAITVEISALAWGDTPETPFFTVNEIDEIVIGRDGLYIEIPPHRGGLLLPQVATERGWNTLQFLESVCLKAGYPDDAWKQPDANLCRFSAQVFGEETSDAG